MKLLMSQAYHKLVTGDTIEAHLASGKSLRAVAAELEALGVKTARGGDTWTPTAVKNALAR